MRALIAIAWTITLSASVQAAPPDWARLAPESPFLTGSAPLWPELLAPRDDAGGSFSISLRYPQYRQPPPIDDARPNETTWTVFKKQVDRAADQAAGKTQ